MCIEVQIEQGFVTEGFGAMLTHVWPVGQVNMSMKIQLNQFTEDLATLVAHKPDLVGQSVSSQRFTVSKTLFALSTSYPFPIFEWFKLYTTFIADSKLLFSFLHCVRIGLQ